MSKSEAGPPAGPEKVDILWGWKEIADAVQVSVTTAKRLVAEEGLPVLYRRGRRLQSSRKAIQRWANGELEEDDE